MFNSLKSKITWVYFSIVLLIAFVGALSVINIASIHTSIENIMQANYKSIQYSQGMMYLLSNQNGAVLSYIRGGDETSADAFFSGIQPFDNLITEERNSLAQTGEKELVDDVHDRYIQFQKYFSDLKLIRQTQSMDAAFSYYNQTVMPNYSKMTEDINNISELNQQGLSARKEKTSTQAVWSLYILCAATALAVLTGLFISMHFADRFLRPLQRMTKNVCELRTGKLNLKLDVTTNDEIGRLAHEFNNMTERLSAFEQSTKGELMKEKNRSLAIVHSISDPLIVLDSRYRITLVNPAGEAYLGVREPDAVNRHFLECVHNGALYNLIAECAENGLERREKIMKLGEGESTCYYNIVVAPIKNNPDGGFVFLMQNVTELKQLETAKTNFIATISHEFKTPLTLVTMGVSMLQNGRTGELNERQKTILSTIMEYSENLDRLVEDLLELAKIESGKSVYHFQKCNTAEIVEAGCRLFENKAASDHIALEWTCEENLPAVRADTVKLAYVLNNLLSNAVKYTREGGRIRVNAFRRQKEIVLTVQDNGEGIPREYLERIFDQFVQVDAGRIEGRGSGLGLYAAREIVHAHGGEITVQSEPGIGSIFTVTLPVFEEEAE